MITKYYTLFGKFELSPKYRHHVFFFEISYPAGLPHSPDLLRYRAFAVVHYSCTLDALHLQQMRQSQNIGEIFSIEIRD